MIVQSLLVAAFLASDPSRMAPPCCPIGGPLSRCWARLSPSSAAFLKYDIALHVYISIEFGTKTRLLTLGGLAGYQSLLPRSTRQRTSPLQVQHLLLCVPRDMLLCRIEVAHRVSRLSTRL